MEETESKQQFLPRRRLKRNKERKEEKKRNFYVERASKAEMYTLIAGTGEKLVFNRPNQKRIEKSRAVVSHAFQSTIRPHFSVLPIFTPFSFSVFSLGSRSFSLGSSSAVREISGKKKIGESKNLGERSEPSLSPGRGRVAPFPLSQ